jgi:hypothetical protein
MSLAISSALFARELFVVAWARSEVLKLPQENLASGSFFAY